MNFTEKTIKTEIVYKGKIITLSVDTVKLPNGKEATREIISHPGGVAILPVDEDNNAYLVRQFRKPFDDLVLEAPAGKLSVGEQHKTCGIRELEEETGFVSADITYLGYILPTPGYTNEIIHLYLARNLTLKQQNLDEDEFLNVEKYNFDDVVKMCLNNEIVDGKTVALVLRANEIMKMNFLLKYS